MELCLWLVLWNVGHNDGVRSNQMIDSDTTFQNTMSNSNEEEGLHPKQQCLKPSENTSRPQALKNATLVFQQNIAAENNLDEAVANEPAQSQPSEFRSTPGMSCKDFDWAPQDHVDDLNAVCCGMKNMDDYLDDGGDRRAFKWRDSKAHATGSQTFRGSL